MTVQDLLNGALLDLGSIAQGETPSTDESAAGLIVANQILSSWSLEGATVYNQQRQTFAVNPGNPNYTLGPGGSWSTFARPVKITGAIAKSGSFQAGMRVVPFAEFAREITNATGRTDVLPTLLGYDNASPINVEVFPPPSTGCFIELQTWQPLTAFAALADVLNFPVPGFEAALRAELVVTLATAYGKEATPTMIANAQRFKQRIMAVNAGMDGALPAPPQTTQNPNA